MNNSIKNLLLSAALLLVIPVFLSCAGSAQTSCGPADGPAVGSFSGPAGSGQASGLAVGGRFRNISEIRDRDWILEEIWVNSIQVHIDRTGGGREIFTLRFDTDSISGAGAPNRYFAPYTDSGFNTLSIGMIAGTLMAPLFEPEGLKEHEYFAYLGNSRVWDLINGKLELYSRDNNGNPVVLIFY